MGLIYTYATKQAVEDSILDLISAVTSKEARNIIPVYLTKAVLDRYVEVPSGMEGEQDVSGRLWDILFQSW
jgi:hypothetical protein